MTPEAKKLLYGGCRNYGRTQEMLWYIDSLLTKGAMVIVPARSAAHARLLHSLITKYGLKVNIRARIALGAMKVPYKSRRSIFLEVIK